MQPLRVSGAGADFGPCHTITNGDLGPLCVFKVMELSEGGQAVTVPPSVESPGT